MNTALQDAAFNRGRLLSVGGVFSKWLAEGATFNIGRYLSEGGVYQRAAFIRGRRSLEEIRSCDYLNTKKMMQQNGSYIGAWS